MRVLIGLASLALLGSATAVAQSLAELEAAGAAVAKAWAATPIVTRTALLVADPPAGFGLYEPQPTTAYRPGEPIIAYAEPLGYGYSQAAPGLWQFGFDIDLLIKTADGQVLGGQENFERLALTSRAQNREFMLTLTLDLEGAPPGDYVVDYTLDDIVSDKTGLISLPFSIVDD
jgi:hypothetical protein